jgi:arginase family enzyme
MPIFDYFEPVSLNKPDDADRLLNQNLFCKNIYTNTPNSEQVSLTDYDVAIIGVPEFRACYQSNLSHQIDVVRENLYLLNYFEKKIRIIDLGNLKLGNTISDTYYGLRDVIVELLLNKIVPVIVGGSHDLTYALCMAFEYLKQIYTLATIDYRIDMAFETFEKVTSKNYLNTTILDSRFLFEYINLGHQACFSNADHSDIFESLFHDNIRLGLMRNNTKIAEPLLRDSDIISIDMAAVRHADAPGQLIVSPNGFNGEDLCQLAHYAGIGEKGKVFGLFEIASNFDQRNVTALLAAQTIWYFINALSIRPSEKPALHPQKFKQYFVAIDDLNQMVFYKSAFTGRWWAEVPVLNESPIIIACSEDDYKNAMQGQIPDRWLKMFKKHN